MRRTRPVFQNVVDLGLRDVGVKNDRRRLAMHAGKVSVAGLVLSFVIVLVACAVLRQLGAQTWIVALLALASTACLFALALRATKSSPPVAVKVDAEGTNHAVRLAMTSFGLLGLVALLSGNLLLVPIALLAVVMAALVWKQRGQLPRILRRLRTALASDESVLGDGVGMARGARRDGFRLIVCTDRRVLVATTSRSVEFSILVDVPYEAVSRFDIDWKYGGRLGVLSLTVDGAEDAPSKTHVIGHIAPMNLMSIVRAFESHGVPADDPAVVSEAELALAEAQQSDWAHKPLLDRESMRTPAFDRGLWLLVGLSAPVLYFDLFGGWLGLLLFAAVSVVSGYVSGTRSALAYLVPLTLLIFPMFIFVEPSMVIVLLVMLNVVAAVGLAAGSALRGATAGASTEPAPDGSLRSAIGGPGLIRISGIMLAATLALGTVAAAAGFEMTTVRLAIDEATSTKLRVDGRSNLTGSAASFTYTPGPGLRELVTDEDWGAGPHDGARWELRSPFAKGHNVVSLAHYIFTEPRLDDPAAIADFVADKDEEHTRLAGFEVGHTERVVDGRKGYVWNHDSYNDYWYYVAWFPDPVHSVRVECIAKNQKDRFKKLCSEAFASLKFHGTIGS